MTIFRFLQARPYWLYKLAAVLVVVVVVLTLIYARVVRNDVIVYPLVVLLLPSVIYGSFAATLLAPVGETLIDLTRKPRGSVWVHIGLVLVVAISVIVGLALLGPSVPSIQHVRTLQYDNHVYNLARENLISAIGWDASSVHILYECDSLGIICHVLHSEALSVSTLSVPQTTIELAANPDRNAISILVDGEVAYTYAV